MKKWRNISITKKVFLVTLLSIVTLLALFFVVQGVLYSKLYSYTKEQALKEAVTKLADDYSVINDRSEIQRKISEYSAESNSYIMVIDDSGIKYAVSYEMEVEASSGEKMRFLLDNALRSKDFTDLNIKTGDTVEISFMKFNRGSASIYIPESISKNGNTWRTSPAKHFIEPRPDDHILNEENNDNKSEQEKNENEKPAEGTRFENITETITGQVSSIVMPIAEYNSTVQRSDALSALMIWLDEFDSSVQSDKKLITYKYKSRDSDDSYNIAVMPLENNEFIFAVISMRHIGEAVGILNDMIIPWTVVAGIMALVVGASFSFIITKPILKITKITTKMKDLDFSEHCSVSGSDELGVLANNVNEMSDKLDGTIKELVEANNKLTEDINHERMLEQQRKEFVAAVSHELKTPLAIIRAYAEGLIDGVSENKRLKYMNVIVDETKKMDRLVLDMLENSKLEAGVEKLNIKQYSITKIINKYIKLLDENFKQKSLKVEVYADTAAVAEVDCDKMEQVISNFLSNALKNTPHGGSITAFIGETDTDILLKVENTGNHIEESELPKVWDKFYKCDKSRDRKDNGTGLGLSIAKNILILHKAEYGVKNTENGVCFFFKIPKKAGHKKI